MPNFKEQSAQDLSVFANPDEFAEPYNIDGRTLTIVIDNDRLQERSEKEYDGIAIGDLLYFVSADAYGPPPEIDAVQVFDKKYMQVFNVRIDAGIYEIILRRNI